MLVIGLGALAAAGTCFAAGRHASQRRLHRGLVAACYCAAVLAFAVALYITPHRR